MHTRMHTRMHALLSARARLNLNSQWPSNTTAVRCNTTAVRCNKTAVRCNKTAVRCNKTTVRCNKTTVRLADSRGWAIARGDGRAHSRRACRVSCQRSTSQVFGDIGANAIMHSGVKTKELGAHTRPQRP